MSHGGLSLLLCDDRDGWDGGGCEGGSGGMGNICVYVVMTDSRGCTVETNTCYKAVILLF